jgi:hypothetical protein
VAVSVLAVRLNYPVRLISWPFNQSDTYRLNICRGSGPCYHQPARLNHRPKQIAVDIECFQFVNVYYKPL